MPTLPELVRLVEQTYRYRPIPLGLADALEKARNADPTQADLLVQLLTVQALIHHRRHRSGCPLCDVLRTLPAA